MGAAVAGQRAALGAFCAGAPEQDLLRRHLLYQHSLSLPPTLATMGPAEPVASTQRALRARG